MVFILSALGRIWTRGLWKLPDGRDWLRGKLGLVLMGRAMLSKSLMEFPVDGWGCVPSLLVNLRPNYGGGNEENGDHLQKVPRTHCPIQCPWPCGRPPQTHASAGDSGTFMSKSELVSCGSLLLSPGSWCAQGFFCVLQESVSPVPCMFWQLYGGVNGNLLKEGLGHTYDQHRHHIKKQRY